MFTVVIISACNSDIGDSIQKFFNQISGNEQNQNDNQDEDSNANAPDSDKNEAKENDKRNTEDNNQDDTSTDRDVGKGEKSVNDEHSTTHGDEFIDVIYEALVLEQAPTLYKEPDTSSAKVGYIDFGEHVLVKMDEGDWSYIYSEQIEGWIMQRNIKEIPYDSSQKIEVQNPEDILVLVNKQYRLPRDYVPEPLVIPDVPFPFQDERENMYMREDAANALENMFAAIRKEGMELFGLSGYRSFATQQQIFPTHVRNGGFVWANNFSAFPGESEHQTGLAMDVTSREVGFGLTQTFGDTKEGQWVENNAHKFGFIVRYPEGMEHITGYKYEPWHLRYVGKKHAKNIYELDITLEEYVKEHVNNFNER